MAFESTCGRNLVRQRPGRRYERKTKRLRRPVQDRKPGEITRLTPLTRIIFWLMLVPSLN